jgi:hypothetical protein
VFRTLGGFQFRTPATGQLCGRVNRSGAPADQGACRAAPNRCGARARFMVVGRSGIHDPDYPGTVQYVLRRRDRFGFRAAIFLFAVSAGLLTVATVSVATGYTSVAGVWDFLVFGLLIGAGGIFGLRDRAAIVGQVLMAVGDAGIYLTEPPRCIPWPEVAGLVLFRTWQDDDDAESGAWLSQLAVVSSGELCQPGAGALCLPSPGQGGVTVNLHDEKVRLGKLSDAVHTCAPGLPVWDVGKIKRP